MRALHTLDMDWTDIRSAYKVAKHENLAAAADELGVHRATLIRRIDSVETALGVRLFIRHKHGYTPTDAGEEFAHIVDEAEVDLSSLAARMLGQNKQLSGLIHVASAEICAPIALPLIAQFQSENPKVQVRFTPTHLRPRLELGEAHISLKVGAKVDRPDYNHEALSPIRFGLFASRTYADRFGIPSSLADAHEHRFVAIETSPTMTRVGIHSWMEDRVPESSIAVRSESPWALDNAMLMGMGIGFYPLHLARDRQDLIPVWEPWDDISIPAWAITHRDASKNAKIARLLSIIRTGMRDGQVMGDGQKQPGQQASNSKTLQTSDES
ncbi:MAG: LysR family transcriptional regulator [Pseudomonadota bacterium]